MSASARAFVCECGGRGCRAEARLTQAEYVELRAAGLKLVVTAAHDAPAGIVVSRGPGWVAVGRRRRQLGMSAADDLRQPQPALEVRRCPTCEAETIVSDTGHCLWCGTGLTALGAAA